MGKRGPADVLEALPALVLLLAAVEFWAVSLAWGAAGFSVGLLLLGLGWVLAMELEDRVHR